jgi:hypothetical protein
MSQALSGTVRTIISMSAVNTLDLSAVTDAVAKTETNTYANGTGANQVQVQWHDQRTLLTTAGETLDLTALAGGAFGTANFGKVKELIIKLVTATSGYRLQVGDAAGTANKWTAPFADPADIITPGAGGILHLSSPVDGWTVDGTHKLLLIYNPSGGSVVFDIYIAGTGTMA